MKTKYFNIGDNDWGIVMVYDYTDDDYEKLWSMIRAFGMPDEKAMYALGVLSRPDSGMTLTSMSDMMSVIFVSEATSDDEWFNTLVHELKHVVEHISEFYNVSPKSEPAAYLQGEIGRQMFPLIMQKMCGK